MTFDATVNPVVYEGGVPVFIDTEYGLPISKIERTIGEIGADFGDGSYIIYVNAAMQDEETELGRLMHDFHCKDAGEMYSEVLAKRVRELKETEEGVYAFGMVAFSDS